MKRIVFNGAGSVNEVMAAFREEQPFQLVLLGKRARFLGPYVASMMTDAVQQFSRTRAVAKITAIGWTLRALWLPSLATYYEIAKSKGWPVRLTDRGDDFEIEFGVTEPTDKREKPPSPAAGG